MGRNRPAEAMPFNDMVWRYLIIYIVNLFLPTNETAAGFNRLCAWCCTQHLMHTGNYCQLFPRSLRLHIGMCLRRSLNGLILSAYAWFHPSCCWTKIAPPVPSCNSPFTFTHDSCVMSTICQSPRACCDDFQQLLPSRMD